MPNYFVTNTARFNPFTYQELATPLLQATQQHLAMEEALSSLDDGTLATYLAGESQDSSYVSDYKKLSKRVENLSQQLATEGISGAIMRDALKLKGDYKKFSTPVETAGKRRYQLMDEYRKLKASNPYLIGEDPGQKDLAFYINNPNYNPEYDNGEAYIKQGTLIGSQLADQLRNPDAPYTVVPGSGGAFLRAVYRRGYTPEEIASDPMFVNITNQIMQSRGVDPEGTDARTNAIRSYIQQGLFSSLGKDDVDMRNNPGYLNALQQEQLKRLKTPPQDPEAPSTKYDDFKYSGEKENWASNLLKSVLKDYNGGGVKTADGTPLNNSVEVKHYLDTYKSDADSARKKYLEYQTNGTSQGEREKKKLATAYKELQKAYNEEKERLSQYSIADKDYRDIKRTLNFDDTFSYDDVLHKIGTTRSQYSGGSFPAYSLAAEADSKENFNRYLSEVKTYANDYKDSKNMFYRTNGVSLGEPLTGKQVLDALENHKPNRISTSTPLMWNGTDQPYAIIVTESAGKIAVPMEMFGDLTESLRRLVTPGYEDYNRLNRAIEKGFGINLNSGILDSDLNDLDYAALTTFLNTEVDTSTRGSKRTGQERTEYEKSPSKGTF